VTVNSGNTSAIVNDGTNSNKKYRKNHRWWW
jgi:hypothetical protein